MYIDCCSFQFFSIQVSTWTSLSDNFLLCRQQQYGNINVDTVALDRPKILPVVRSAPTFCPLLSSDMSPIMLCGLHILYLAVLILCKFSRHTRLLLMECKISEDWPPGLA